MSQTLTWPLRMQRGRLAAVEQYSPADRASCVVCVLSYPKGWRFDNPDFGRQPDLDFRQGGVDVATLIRDVQTSEPRATPEAVADVLSGGTERVSIGAEHA